MTKDPQAKKHLGQHWLEDQASLQRICEAGELDTNDTVVEIGPGKGALTEYLVQDAKRVIAIEYDNFLANTLLKRFEADNLVVVNEDCLVFDYSSLPAGYKVIANIPYYLTSNLLRVLSENPNPPKTIVLLIQQEVAERVAARPGDMSILAVTVQYYYEAELDILVSADKFNPAPKVDSQVVILRRRSKKLFGNIDQQKLFNIVKAGFYKKKKKIKTSLATGLGLEKEKVLEYLSKAGVSPDCRPQELSIEDWFKIYKQIES